MEKTEYENSLKILHEEFKKNKNSLARSYALSNKIANVGQVVTDHIGILKVETIKWQYGLFGSLPQCVYYGIELKKDLTPMKKQSKRGVYECNIINQ